MKSGNRGSIELALQFLLGLVTLCLVVAYFFASSAETLATLRPLVFGSFMGFITFSLTLWVFRPINDPLAPTVVASLPDALTAGMIVTQLESSGISARAVGGYTSGFQTEVASDVKVVVAKSDVAAAKEVLKKV